ncbi:hypothetical protein LZ30DRAFT_714038 [Colletotrichum cereale]|nr:hypothetical protein LZ30DRAFT_714038 [Colletotrichum cereale]
MIMTEQVFSTYHGPSACHNFLLLSSLPFPLRASLCSFLVAFLYFAYSFLSILELSYGQRFVEPRFPRPATWNCCARLFRRTGKGRHSRYLFSIPVFFFFDGLRDNDATSCGRSAAGIAACLRKWLGKDSSFGRVSILFTASAGVALSACRSLAPDLGLPLSSLIAAGQVRVCL